MILLYLLLLKNVLCFVHAQTFQGCGGQISEKTGIISSPNFPRNYPHNSDCYWTITAADNEVVFLRFEHLDLAGSSGDSCADYVTVRDGDSVLNTVLVKLCLFKSTEELANITIRSTMNKLQVHFHSNGYDHNSGFDARFRTHVCEPFKFGSELCDQPCNCVQPNTRYCNSVNGTCACKTGWSGTDCSIDIDECGISIIELCTGDYQQCVNGPGDFTCECKSGMLKNSTGHCEVASDSSCDETICSHVCVNLSSNQKLCYCPLGMTLHGSNCRECSSLSYGHNCSRRCDCSESNSQRCDPQTGDCVCKPGWTSSRCSVDINECHLASRVCETNADCINTLGSFSCQVRQTNPVNIPCTYTVHEPSGVIASPNYPQPYQNGLHCTWLISYGSNMATITLRFPLISLEHNYDFLNIFDGTNTSSPLVASFTGMETDVLLRSTGNTMFIVFTSDSIVAYAGFNGTFHISDTPGCGGMLLHDSENITTVPMDIANPNDFFFCYWNILANNGKLITLKLENIDLPSDCSIGYFKVYNQPGVLGFSSHSKYCGINVPRLMRSTTNKILFNYFVKGNSIQPKLNAQFLAADCNWRYGNDCETPCICDRRYTTSCNNLNGHCTCRSGMNGSDCSLDNDECSTGFNYCPSGLTCKNTFQSYECGLNKSEPSGQFGCYSHSQPYQVLITGQNGTVVSLSVSDFNMESGDNCYYHMSVYDGAYSSSQLIGRYCGSRIPRLLRTTQHIMRIVINNNKGHTVCQAQYEINSCPSFHYGPACSRRCQCVQNRTRSCDNLYGICECEPGWTGRDCSGDIDECQFVRNCTDNSECKNTPGSYECLCRQGYSYNNQSKLCQLSQECPEPERSQCSHACYVADGRPKCGCPEHLVLDDIGKLDCLGPFYTPFGEDIIFTSDVKSKKINFSTKVPFGTNKTVSSAYITKSGVILFDNFQQLQPSCIEGGNAVKLLAALWSIYDDNVGTVSYNLIESCKFDDPFKSIADIAILQRASKSVKEMNNMHNFEATTVFIVTWHRMQLKKSTAQLTFQSIYISGYEKLLQNGQEIYSDTKTGYVKFIYQKGKDHWDKNNFLCDIGYTTGDLTKSLCRESPQVFTNLGNINFFPDLPGVIMFSVGNISGQEQKCERYLCKYSSLQSSDKYWSEVDELYKCPCSLDRLGLQWDLFERRGEMNCYAISQRAKTRLLPHNPRNKICCYRRPAVSYSISELRSATFFQNSSNGGHLLPCDPWQSTENWMKAKENIEAHKWCCSGSPMCNKFYEIFPDLPCSHQVTFVSPTALGDPHITTLDGLTYPMNGWGEFIMLDVPKENCMLQARTGRVESKSGDLLNATVFIAFAAKQSKESNFQVELALTNITMNIYVNNQDITREFYEKRDFSISTDSLAITREIKNNKTTVKALFSCGFGMEVQLGVKSLDILMQVDHVLKYQTRGLFGNYSDDIRDDFQLLNGTIISINSTEREIFMNFVKDYEVNSSTTIFSYEAGESNKDYRHPDFIPMFLDELDSNTLTAAKDFCGADNLPCVYDFAATKDLNFARNTRDTKNESDSMINGLVNKPPEIKSLNSSTFLNNHWVVTKGRTAILQVFAVDEDKDALSFIIEGNLTNISVSSKGLIRFTPGSIPQSNLVIKVKDSKGGYSASILIPLVYCSECNNHGLCDTELSPIADGVEKFKCQCYPAYTGEECESELDACSLSPCQPGRECTDLSADQQGNSTVGYRCGACPTGYYVGTDDICLDINECDDQNTCAHNCTNTFGSYTCSCNAGYRLNQANLKNCTDIDECAEKTSLCQQLCQNTKGSYTCTCLDGYTKHIDGFQCVLDNNKQSECQKCQQTCLLNHNTITCGCNSGYKMDPNDATKCIDIDECMEESVPCSQNCINTEGHYKCSCQVGYQLNIDNVTCTECKSPYYGHDCNSTCDCGIFGYCHPSEGCKCHDGWTGQTCNEDFNECTIPDACPLGQLCNNVVGSYHCHCHSGYTKINGICTDIDECSDFQLVPFCRAELHETCVNTIGSFMCQCIEGFHLTRFSVCEDIDECSAGIDDCEQLCENTLGSFNCKCHPGFWKSVDRKHCVDVKQICKDQNMTCSHNCTVDTNGRPFCICPRGYQLTGSNICQDINECVSSILNLCSYKEGCNNTEGGFTCSCLAGQKLDNDGRTCIDCEGDTWGYQCANHCACGFGSDRCDPKFGCVCKPTYKGHYCTEDVDECATAQLICSHNEICVNKPGSAECQCNVGFHLKNGTCSDIDECIQGTHHCQETCINVEGSYNCSCSAENILQDDGHSCAARAVGCHKVLSNKTGQFMSPNYPLNYPDNANCSWTVTTSITNSYISLSFQTYDVEGCPYDFIEVYDGSSKAAGRLSRLCNSLPDTIKSTGSSLHIVFISDESENRKGFLASYVAEEHCRYKNCSHTCQVTANPRSEVCTCPDWMKLDADETHCSVINACNTTVQMSSGYIVSPNYPYNYPNNVFCYWTIQTGSDLRVNLSFTDIVMEGGDGCPYDYISINDGSSTSAPLLGKYCNADILPNVLSTKEALHISFKSDGSASSKGFKAAFFTVD